MFWSKAIAHILALLPFAWLAWKVWRDALGADPVAEITHFTGNWALRMLLITLAVTPLRRFTGWSVLVRFRRLLGLYAFFYASLHFLCYLALDLGGYWAQILPDIGQRPFITLGFLTWLGLLLLAATSTQAMMRRLGRHWAQLHRLVYAAGLLAVLHYLWLIKSDLRAPLLYAAIFGLLMLLRFPPLTRRMTRKPAPRVRLQRGA